MEYIYLCQLDADGKHESWNGVISPLVSSDHTEYRVSARGSCFHLVIGRHWYSSYIYIPTWNIAMDISSPEDRFWNREQLQHSYPELSPVDAESIIEALAAIKSYSI